MNIFVLSQCPVESAQLQCDKHVVKMIVESAQMLSTAHRMLDGIQSIRLSKSGRKLKYYQHPDKHFESELYLAVHHGHPSTVWTMESEENYLWHYEHFIALCEEYEHRYGKRHATYDKLSIYLAFVPENIPKVKQTPFKLAMGSNPECMFSDAVKSYRAFYQTKQDRFKMAWTKRPIPEWFIQKNALLIA